MNDTPPDKEHRNLLQNYAHKELREIVENALKFITLSILLLWARGHTHSIGTKGVLEASSLLCIVPGLQSGYFVFWVPSHQEAVDQRTPFPGAARHSQGHCLHAIGDPMRIVRDRALVATPCVSLSMSHE